MPDTTLVLAANTGIGRPGEQSSESDLRWLIRRPEPVYYRPVEYVEEPQ